MAAPFLLERNPKLKLYTPSLDALNELNLGSKSAFTLRFCNIKNLDDVIKNGTVLFRENSISIMLVYCTPLR